MRIVEFTILQMAVALMRKLVIAKWQFQVISYSSRSKVLITHYSTPHFLCNKLQKQVRTKQKGSLALYLKSPAMPLTIVIVKSFI